MKRTLVMLIPPCLSVQIRYFRFCLLSYVTPSDGTGNKRSPVTSFIIRWPRMMLIKYILGAKIFRDFQDIKYRFCNFFFFNNIKYPPATFEIAFFVTFDTRDFSYSRLFLFLIGKILTTFSFFLNHLSKSARN